MRIVAISAAVAVFFDQLSKLLVIHVMELWRLKSIKVFPPYLNFEYGENRGINFGIGDGLSRWTLVAIAISVCLAIIWWMLRAPQPAIARLSAGFLIGGALGNVIDRAWHGYVLDFLNNDCCGIGNPFVYNVADIFIFVGAMGLVFFSKDGKPEKKGA